MSSCNLILFSQIYLPFVKLVENQLLMFGITDLIMFAIKFDAILLSVLSKLMGRTFLSEFEKTVIILNGFATDLF